MPPRKRPYSGAPRRMDPEFAAKAAACVRPVASSRQLKRAHTRSASSTRWLQRQLRDPYVRRAQNEGYRSRSVYKLWAMDAKYGLLDRAHSILDVGAAPGGWSQYCRRKRTGAQILALDLAPFEPIEAVGQWQADIADPGLTKRLRDVFSKGVDLVLCDVAPANSGDRAVDDLRMQELVARAATLATSVLRPEGHFLCKTYQSIASDETYALLKRCFARLDRVKPEASRRESPEVYLVARQFDSKRMRCGR